jgi:hypothetical protein
MKKHGPQSAEEVVRLAAAGRYGRTASLHGTQVTSVPASKAIAELKQVDPESDTVQKARTMGIVFG